MKQTLPAINIPSRRVPSIPESPISVTSSLPSTLRTPFDDNLSFAAIWDHGHGALESLKTPMSHLSGFRADPHGPFPVDVDGPATPFLPEFDEGEPFAILGSVGGRNPPCFIGLESAKEYDKFIHTGLTPERVRTKKLSTHKPRNRRSDSQKVSQKKSYMTPKSQARPAPLLPALPRNVVYRPEIPPTPQSALTFAAVWDPEHEGMSTFRGGRFFEDSYKAPLLPPGKHDELLDNARIRSRYMLPKDSHQRTKTVASSTLNGLDVYIPQPKPTPLKLQKKAPPRRPPTIEVDDEGFFETFSDNGHADCEPHRTIKGNGHPNCEPQLTSNGHGHPDCEPHLSSRFSVTTTSTSNYVDIDFPESVHEETVPPVPSLPAGKQLERSESTASLKSAISPPFLLFQSRRPSNDSTGSLAKLRSRQPSNDSTTSLQSTNSKFHSLTRSKSSPGSARRKASGSLKDSNSATSPSSYKQPSAGRPRLSNVFGKLRRNSQDEGWVSVEVTSVITDRIIKEA